MLYKAKVVIRFGIHTKYRVVRSRLTHFKFEYCTGAIACRGWREAER